MPGPTRTVEIDEVVPSDRDPGRPSPDPIRPEPAAPPRGPERVLRFLNSKTFRVLRSKWLWPVWILVMLVLGSVLFAGFLVWGALNVVAGALRTLVAGSRTGPGGPPAIPR